ncbi:hypothetical protein C0J52_02560 [Blattella germanica]|nr:hypothetical protein C0J52_02560 [Blattella germanica]
MELDLSRVDYTLVGITSPQTMKLLPNMGTRIMQKIAVADQDGVLQVFSVKKGDIQLGFKTLPGPGISRLELGGALDRSSLLHNIEIDGVPTVLHLNGNEGGEAGDEILYGTSDGKVGLVRIGRVDVNHRWVLNDGKRRGGVLCMDCYDMSGDGVLDLLVGRQDGTMDVYSLGDDGGEEGKLTQRFTYACNESITSIHGGVVGNSGYEEVVAATYTGFVFGMVTCKSGEHPIDSTGTSHSEISERLENLRFEIEEIEQRVSREREKYQAATQDKSDGLSAIPFISVNDKLSLCGEDASYSLTIEVQTAIDNVLIQSDVPVDLLDVDRNSAVVSYSACEPGWEFLVSNISMPDEYNTPGVEIENY